MQCCLLFFHGKTENLIPLYAVGVFIPFTLAQYGMVLKWVRGREKDGLLNLLQML